MTDVHDTADAIIGLDPTGDRTATAQRARRRTDLGGAVLGLVSNRKGSATAFLTALAAELDALGSGLAGTVLIEKESVFAAPDPGDWARLTAGADVAIAGYGG